MPHWKIQNIARRQRVLNQLLITSRKRRAIRVSYGRSIEHVRIKNANGTLEGSRTPNLLIRSQALYPIELRVLIRVAGL